MTEIAYTPFVACKGRVVDFFGQQMRYMSSGACSDEQCSKMLSVNDVSSLSSSFFFPLPQGGGGAYSAVGTRHKSFFKNLSQHRLMCRLKYGLRMVQSNCKGCTGVFFQNFIRFMAWEDSSCKTALFYF